MRIEKAKYHEAILPEHKGNPFIEALYRKLPAEELMEKFCYYPDLDVHIRKHPDPLVRDEFTIRLKALRQPQDLYVEIFRAIEIAIKAGYAAKNPLSPTTAQFLHYRAGERPEIEPCTGYFEPKGEGLTLIGPSGVGKTCLLEQILNYFPSVILHDEYKGQKMEHQRQIVWIKVDCPNNSSVRDLCEEILAALDQIVEYEPTRPERTIGQLTRQIEQKIKANFLGLLVIDEMQRLTFSRTGGENNLLNFIHSLVNKLGVPIFFCANPPFDKTLSKTLKSARRAESGGYFEMNPLERHSKEWSNFIEELWDLHWTNVSTELTEELNDKIFELSVGSVDMAHRIYRNAQRLVIGTNNERITIEILEQAAVSALRSSSQTDEVKQSRERYAMPRRSTVAKKQTDNQVSTQARRSTKTIWDVTRPQHPEFEAKLQELVSCIDLVERIEDPDFLRQAFGQKSSDQYIREAGLMCEDPLTQFA